MKPILAGFLAALIAFSNAAVAPLIADRA